MNDAGRLCCAVGLFLSRRVFVTRNRTGRARPEEQTNTRHKGRCQHRRGCVPCRTRRSGRLDSAPVSVIRPRGWGKDDLSITQRIISADNVGGLTTLAVIRCLDTTWWTYTKRKQWSLATTEPLCQSSNRNGKSATILLLWYDKRKTGQHPRCRTGEVRTKHDHNDHNLSLETKTRRIRRCCATPSDENGNIRFTVVWRNIENTTD